MEKKVPAPFVHVMSKKNKEMSIEKEIIEWFKKKPFTKAMYINACATCVMAIISAIMIYTLFQNSEALKQNKEALNMNKKEFRLRNRPFLDVQKGLLGGAIFGKDGKTAPFSANLALSNNSSIPATSIFVYCKVMLDEELKDDIEIDVGSISQGIPWELEIPLAEDVYSGTINENKILKIHVKIAYSGLAK